MPDKIILPTPISQDRAAPFYPTKGRRLPGARLIDRLFVAYARMPDHPMKVRILRRLLRLANPGPILVSNAGSWLRIEPEDYIGWSLLTTGDYEPKTLSLAARLLISNPGLFVDIGANSGLYTVSMAAITGVNVVAVEPDCANCNKLRNNIALNGLSNVTVFNGAAGSSVSLRPIKLRTTNNSGTFFISNVINRHERNENWIATHRIDDILTSILRTAERPVLIKIDIEGFEPEALSGLEWRGPWRPRNVIFEFNLHSESGWGSFDAMKDFFLSRGYGLYTVDGQVISTVDKLIEDNIWARDEAAPI